MKIILYLIFALFISTNANAISFNFNKEISKFIDRLSDNEFDLKNYYEFCKNNNFHQCTSSHYLYNPISKERFQKESKYIISLYKYLEQNLSEIPLTTDANQTKESKIDASVEMALIGDAMGFLIESENTIESIQAHFPSGILNSKRLQKNLTTYKQKTKYGEYNSNNLSKEKKIIYSDDTELSLVTLYSAITSYKKSSSDIQAFTNQIKADLISHWANLKRTGNYGVNGLYYGPRGYGKKSLQSLSDLFYNKATLTNHPNNGELIRSWVLGLMPYDSYLIAAFYAASQSLVSNKSYEVAISCAAMAAGIHVAVYDSPKSKEEVVNKMIDTASLLESLLIANYDISNYLKYAKAASLFDINPIIFYNSSIGYYAKEAISAIVFTFLRHEYFLTALLESAHIAGDSDSIAHLVGAIMGAYYGIGEFPKNYLQYIEIPEIALNNKKITFDELLNQIKSLQ